jgi:major outer membrane protein
MKLIKRFFLVALMHSTCFGLPLGNPQEASLLNCGVFNNYPIACLGCRADFVTVKVGYYGDYVFDRHLEAKIPGAEWKGLHTTKLNTNAGLIAVDLFNRGEFFAALGGSNLFLHTRARSLGSPSTFDFILETETKFSWSIGGNGILWKYGPFSLGAEAQYFSFRPRIRNIRFETLNVLYTDRINVKYDEWQLGAGIAYSFYISECATFVPYLGVEWSYAYGDFGDFFLSDPFFTAFTLRGQRFQTEKHFGYAIGLSFVGCGMWELTAEARFVNEKACHIKAAVRF